MTPSVKNREKLEKTPNDINLDVIDEELRSYAQSSFKNEFKNSPDVSPAILLKSKSQMGSRKDQEPLVRQNNLQRDNRSAMSKDSINSTS